MTRKNIARRTTAALIVTGFALLATSSASAGWGTLPGDQVNRVPSGYRTSDFSNRSYQSNGYGNQPYRNQPSYQYGSNYNLGPAQYQARQSNQWNYSPRGGQGRSAYHATTHYDYHAPSVTRHRNHLHYTPGHYDLHESGHYDHR